MILETIALSKQFTRGKKEFFAVKNVNLQIKKGEFITVVGPSGSGKSTLFSMIAGLAKPTSGEIHLKDSKLSYLFQGQSLLPSFNVIDNICIPLYFEKNAVVSKKNALELLKTFELDGLEKEFPISLSGGEQRRISLIRALISSPDIIIADEPTSNLDPENARLVMEFFKDISDSGTTVLISTHDMAALEYADSIYKMKHGVLTK